MGHDSKCIVPSSSSSFRSSVEQPPESFVQIRSGHLPECFRHPEISEKCLHLLLLMGGGEGVKSPYGS